MGCIPGQRYNKIVGVCFKSDRAKEKKLWKKKQKKICCVVADLRNCGADLWLYVPWAAGSHHCDHFGCEGSWSEQR